MACYPIAGITALQALVTHGKVRNGEKVLINGASGGVGHFAVQIARAFGAHVTAVCSSRNAEFAKLLGAGAVIAHDRENIHKHTSHYNLVVDVHGNLRYSDYRRMGKRGVVVGFTNMGHMMGLNLKKAFGRFPLAQFTAKGNARDLETLAGLVASGKLTAHIEKTFPYTHLPEAIGYIEPMRTRGKVAVSWNDPFHG